MAKILLLNGPNLNLLGQREPDVYGVETLEDITATLKKHAAQKNHELFAFQSNDEAELINIIQQASAQSTDYVIFNPAAFSHTSIALRDALLAVNIPFVEIHISNVYQRESFRHHSYFSDIAMGVIVGFGTLGYQLALQAIITDIERQ